MRVRGFLDARVKPGHDEERAGMTEEMAGFRGQKPDSRRKMERMRRVRRPAMLSGAAVMTIRPRQAVVQGMAWAAGALA